MITFTTRYVVQRKNVDENGYSDVVSYENPKPATRDVDFLKEGKSKKDYRLIKRMTQTIITEEVVK